MLSSNLCTSFVILANLLIGGNAQPVLSSGVCKVIAGQEGYSQFCNAAGNSASSCAQYPAFCYYESSTVTQTMQGTCTVKPGSEPWGIYCQQAGTNQAVCQQYSAFCTFHGSSSTTTAVIPIVSTTSTPVQPTTPTTQIPPTRSTSITPSTTTLAPVHGTCVPNPDTIAWKAYCDMAGTDVSKCNVYSAFCHFQAGGSTVPPTTSTSAYPTTSTSAVPTTSATSSASRITTSSSSTSTHATTASASTTTATSTSTSTQTATPTPSALNNFQGIYIKTWSNGWTWQGILDLFTPLYGVADLAYITFFQPTLQGLDCPSQSPCTTVWSTEAQSTVNASVAYKAGAQNIFKRYGTRTLLSIGGWSYRDDFKFLATMSPTQLSTWANNVKAWVDKFGAHGIDIDYEAETAAQWQSELVNSRALAYLRQAMPSPTYIITFTIGGIAAAAGTPQQVQQAMNLNTQYASTGVALPLIKQHWNDIDRVQLMTYDGEPNMDPRICAKLTIQAFQAMGYSTAQAKAKLAYGAELGEQFGACNGVSTGWCNQNQPLVQSMAQDVQSNNYSGFFYWSNLDGPTSQQYYSLTYPMIHHR